MSNLVGFEVCGAFVHSQAIHYVEGVSPTMKGFFVMGGWEICDNMSLFFSPRVV